jgi:hypothetical protein
MKIKTGWDEHIGLLVLILLVLIILIVGFCSCCGLPPGWNTDPQPPCDHFKNGVIFDGPVQ